MIAPACRRPAGRRRTIATRAPGALLAVALALALGTGCANPADRDDDRAVGGATHVHNLVPGSGGDTVLAGTHHGLVEVPIDGEWRPERVSEYAHDFMGLTSSGDEGLLASGHPDLSSPHEPPHMGLVASRNGGRSWDLVSLGGEVDFHALAAAGDRVYGVDATSAKLLRSDDGGKTWRELAPPEPLVALAADPADPDRLVGSSGALTYRSEDGGESFEILEPSAGVLAWDEAAGISIVEYGTGRLWRSNDARRWRQAGTVPLPDVAGVAVLSEGRLAVIGSSGTLLVSTDGGESWLEVAVIDAPIDREGQDGP